ncbi:transketolase family protein [Herbiconiux sp. SYSU D00978]|uniref:transketolase family protein n=1 Tax=Herbiconiux sp. SYSU D00978 TaxID=2812562 RepID=UPI001A96EBD6|nr:transketolase [Herbiconiux sp. SYSU D00978]
MAIDVFSSSSAAEHRAVAAAVAIPAHVVQAKGHGHAGTAMALAPLAHVLFQRVLRHDPTRPDWEGRDRFILSAGHASLLLYTQLHLTGYDLQLEELMKSRSLGSRTPGHPELHHTAGVEMSTGPLGQGVASAVGLALAARRDSALHGAGTDVFDPTVWVVAGDGCLQEGVSAEASSFAGTQGLDNLVVIWDDNRITIDGPTGITFGEDVRARYRAYGWRVLEAPDFRDLDGLERVLLEARSRTGAPTLVALRTTIGWPSPSKQATPAAHAGGFGEEDVAAIKSGLGFAPDAALEQLVPDEVLAVTRAALDRGRALREDWEERHARWQQEHAEHAERRRSIAVADGSVLDALELPAEGAAVATRKTSGAALKALHGAGVLFGGSADLSESTNVAVPGVAVSAEHPGGAFIPFGIREHAMAAMLSGIALHGLWRPYGSTYLVFSDYLRPSLRLAALMGLPVVYVFTHDSVAVGEDGPTHQPVEQVASLRTVPGLTVLRPADAHEVVAAWRGILEHRTGPVALVLSRQDVPVLPVRDDLDRRVREGGYVVWQHGEGRDLALLATGSEVALALEAGRRLAEDGVEVRVISVPSVEWFAAADDAVREEVLPRGIRSRVAVEAGRGDAWYRWVGLEGRVVSVEEFGESGAGKDILRLRGISLDAVLKAARDTLSAELPAR